MQHQASLLNQLPSGGSMQHQALPAVALLNQLTTCYTEYTAQLFNHYAMLNGVQVDAYHKPLQRLPASPKLQYPFSAAMQAVCTSMAPIHCETGVQDTISIHQHRNSSCRPFTHRHSNVCRRYPLQCSSLHASTDASTRLGVLLGADAIVKQHLQATRNQGGVR